MVGNEKRDPYTLDWIDLKCLQKLLSKKLMMTGNFLHRKSQYLNIRQRFLAQPSTKDAELSDYSNLFAKQRKSEVNSKTNVCII